MKSALQCKGSPGAQLPFTSTSGTHPSICNLNKTCSLEVLPGRSCGIKRRCWVGALRPYNTDQLTAEGFRATETSPNSVLLWTTAPHDSNRDAASEL
eukprot:6946730-Heterocapsa_arctica.AAC.1